MRTHQKIALPQPIDDPSKSPISPEQLDVGPRALPRAGRTHARVDGVDLAQNEEVALRDGSTIELGDFLVLLFTSRAPNLPRRAIEPATTRAFGHADAHGMVGESPAAWALREQLVF